MVDELIVVILRMVASWGIVLTVNNPKSSLCYLNVDSYHISPSR